MTSLQNLPKEILNLIFKNLETSDFQQFQLVCRSFYAPVHLLFLRNIELNSARAVRQFIESIDCNKDASYLSAVNSIRIINANDGSALSERRIKKLWFRFPNLQKVEIIDSLNIFKNFNDDLSTEFLESCKKLNVFKEDSDDDDEKDYELFYKFRHLLTSIDMTDAEEFGGLENGIQQFPRVKEINCVHEQLHNFQEWLPYIKYIPNLESLCIWGSGNDEDGFAEVYLATLPQTEADRVLKILSNIQELDLLYIRGLTRSAAEFVQKYLTNNKKSIKLTHLEFENDLDAVSQIELCNNSFNLVESAKFVSLSFYSLTTESAENCLNTVLERAFNLKCTYRFLNIVLIDANTNRMLVDLEDDVEVRVVTDDLDILIGLNPITVDECRLVISDDTEPVDTGKYLKILRDIPSIKKVVLKKVPDFWFF